MLAEKDHIIEKVERKVSGYESKLKNARMIKHPIKTTRSSKIVNYHTSTGKTAVVATQGKPHTGISNARQYVLAKLSGIPSFGSDDVEWLQKSDTYGSGQFEELKLLTLKKLNIVVAAKVCNGNNSKKAITVETIIGMTVGGHQNFPYVYGLFNETSIIMELFGRFHSGEWTVSPNLGKAISLFNPEQFRVICRGILEAFIWLHSKEILHNDIKSDNIVIHEGIAKIIDFGKANMVSNCLVYSIQPRSEEHGKYDQNIQPFIISYRISKTRTVSFKRA